ncbi:MAG: M81 family metallopeptidase [Thalassobaculales bacterium]
MPRILIVQCMQEISSFNPVPSEYANFAIHRGEEIFGERGRNTSMGGALAVFEATPGVELVPTYSARAGSAGLLSAAGWKRLSGELLAAVAAHARDIDGVYFSLHGAMGADGELDPEGYLLQELRAIVGEATPVVVSLDLHGIMTERMLRHIDGFAIFYTYPHVDMADTGARAARLLLDVIARKLNPVMARVTIPALVRGDELVTKSGCYGDLLREARRLEHEGRALAAGIMIGNPFTDVPELCSQVLICAESDRAFAEREAMRLAEAFWPLRHRMQGKLIPLDVAIAQARHMAGPVIFTDAADATSSGATGDSNAILRALVEAGYSRKVLLPLVDPPAVQAAFAAGVGATLKVKLGGALDPRFTPLEMEVTVDMLSRGRARLETARSPLDAGPSAVLEAGNFTILAMSRSVSLFDRAMFYAHGRDPRDFDLIVVKSPHCEYHMFDEWAEKDFNIDAPGATSADVKNLGHTICRRPMYPIDADAPFETQAQTFHRKRR